jgi:hypothetical protein
VALNGAQAGAGGLRAGVLADDVASAFSAGSFLENFERFWKQRFRSALLSCEYPMPFTSVIPP